uniref:DUF4789 domain-containing protein n=1 Tax=Elaeophora elaphi TaxID=1147741 RepID=A0A0R3RZG1_9BILA
MANSKLIISIIYLFIIVCCNTTSVLSQEKISWNRIFTSYPMDIHDNLIKHHNYANGPEWIGFEQICNGYRTMPLGACSNAYVRCYYNSTGHCVSAILEECPIGKIFNGTVCEVVGTNCISIWSERMGKINFETEKLLERIKSSQQMNFCYDDGSGIYTFPNVICSRQAYVCKNYNEGFAITCLPGMIMLRRPFGCFVYPPSCAPEKISLEQSAPLRQHAIEMYCNKQQSAMRNYRVITLPQVQYVGCGKLIKDIIYCENGFIYDTKLQKCRRRNNEDRCIMPDLCNVERKKCGKIIFLAS